MPAPNYLERQFVTWQRFEADITRLWQILPRPFSGVIGVPRSGMFAAAKIALLEGVPLWTSSPDAAPNFLSRGSRLMTASAAGLLPKAGPLILIEDSVNTGESLARAKAQCPPDTPSATVYLNPKCQHRPDVYAWVLDMPHFFEWHLVGSPLAPAVLFDMDGTLCENCTEADDDDGPRYLRFLETVRPKMLPRVWPCAGIVTARLEKYRPQTEAWLQRYGVKYRRLHMGTWKDLATRRREYDPRRFKGGVYRKLPGVILFVESCPVQARLIFAEVHRPVACNTTGKLWLP